MRKSKDIKLPVLTHSISRFCDSMTECEAALERQTWEVHRGEDKFYDFLFDHAKGCSLVVGVAGAVLPVAALMLWHVSRGGTLF